VTTMSDVPIDLKPARDSASFEHERLGSGVNFRVSFSQVVTSAFGLRRCRAQANWWRQGELRSVCTVLQTPSRRAQDAAIDCCALYSREPFFETRQVDTRHISASGRVSSSTSEARRGR